MEAAKELVALEDLQVALAKVAATVAASSERGEVVKLGMGTLDTAVEGLAMAAVATVMVEVAMEVATVMVVMMVVVVVRVAAPSAAVVGS